MTDDSLDTGNALLDLVAFGAVTAVSIATGVIAGHALTERLRRQDAVRQEQVER